MTDNERQASSRFAAIADIRPSTPVRLLHGIFDNRSKFTDVEIRCSDGQVLYAHKALLAVRERFFKERFFTKQTQGGREGRARGAAIAIFREESTILVPILEFLYTGAIKALEEAPDVLPESDGRLWLRFLTWCARNEITSVTCYVHDVLMGHTLTPSCAAEVLAVLAGADIADVGAERHGSESEDLRARQTQELKALAIHAYQVAEFSDDIFMPLTREALKLLLCSTTFQAPSAAVCRAVAKWARDSEWVKSNVFQGVLRAEHLVDITCFLHPTSMSAHEFQAVAHLFPQAIQTEVWRQLATGQQSSELASFSRQLSSAGDVQLNLRQISRSRMRSSLKQLHREASEAMERGKPSPQWPAGSIRAASQWPNGSLTSCMQALEAELNATDAWVAETAAGMASSPAASPSNPRPPNPTEPPMRQALAQQLSLAGRSGRPEAPRLSPNNSSRRFMTRVESITGRGTTGNLPPLMPATHEQQGQQQVRRNLSIAARSDPGDPISAFQYGVRLHLQAESEFVTLISSDTTHHQSVIYKVGASAGVLRWSIEVVRPCDMLWMGVTAEFDIDTSQWAARYSNVWMASEEGSCLAHLAEFTQVQRERPDDFHGMHPAHVGLTRLPCVRCLTLPDDDSQDSWSMVVAELNADKGELWMDVNKTGMQLVFHSLPTDRPLYPVVSVINASQIRFEHLAGSD